MAELLAPAGSPEALDAAIGEGADAVYLGLKSFNARLRSSNFAWSQFEAAVEALHKRNKKIFVTVNTVSMESEMERMYRFLGYLNRIGPDGLIVQDFGVLNMIRSCYPKLRIHASTQMNIASAKAVNTLSRAGVSRVVLARELNLPEIQSIKEQTSCELEVFVHGALCVSESGLCLFSSFLGGKSANRGLCAQACRRLYTAENPDGIREGYFFSPHDLQLIDRIPDLVQAGVHSFKIEGRMKSAEYVGTVVSAYRYMLDNWESDRKNAAETARRILANDFARAKTRYWYDSEKAEDVLNPDQAGGTGLSLGKIDRITTKNDMSFACLKNDGYEPEQGDSIRLHKKDDSGRESHKIREVVIEKNKRWIDIPAGFGTGDSVYLLQTKNMTKRYPHLLPRDLSPYRSQPGGEPIPDLQIDFSKAVKEKKTDTPSPPKRKGRDAQAFPEGLYVQVSEIDELYTILPDRPVRAIIELNSRTIPALTGSEPAHTQKKAGNLPFARDNIIISLNPFFPQNKEDELDGILEALIKRGFSQFILNNPGHIGLLRKYDVKRIAGPYLYTFNRWAVDWLIGQGLQFFITPLENSRKNLEKTFAPPARSRVMVTLFAYPALFRMRFSLPASYQATWFSDRQEGVFTTISTDDGSYVFPDVPFSLTDKAASIKKAGFRHQLIDLSETRLKKNQYRMVMDSYKKGQVLSEFSRFNWKDGFYDPVKMEEIKQMNERNNSGKKQGKKTLKK
ncbi:U32 family peptidase [Brucepastera parasyntrophica]|uniref:peptidase U32 family protein n=1 Tax=Brucepastera parasyntrophica TaxID=2880008 RepID=UPI00210EF80F|nr:peptidase U32 family protein [Brucepastera parasyntrophica]ULQ60852.1 U32 family peptidase [Brucepastera parasyntrophica]